MPARIRSFSSRPPEIKFPNVYGIDIPTRQELIAHNRTTDEIAKNIGVDWLLYQDLEDLEDAVRSINPELDGFDSSCFSGKYVTADIDEPFLSALEMSKNQAAPGPAAASAAAPAMTTKKSSRAAASPTGECEGLHNPKRARHQDGEFLA